MASPAIGLVRAATEQDVVETLSTITKDGFSLVPKKTRIFIPTNAPIHIFNIENENNEVIGTIQTILEPEDSQVEGFGHICLTTIDREKDLNDYTPAVKAIEEFTKKKGINTIRYEVLATDQEKLKIMEKMGNNVSYKAEYSGNEKVIFKIKD